MNRPVRVLLTEHAAARCSEKGISLTAVQGLVLQDHRRRKRNRGAADWLLSGHGLAVVYNWPHRGDSATALVVSAWQD